MRIVVTNSGRAVARSGLLPRSADELIGYVSKNLAELISLMRKCADNVSPDCDDFAFVIIHAAYSSSEYGGRDLGGKRFLPFQLFKAQLDGAQNRVRECMFSPIEDASTNAAILATRWIGGEDIRDIESVFGIRSGALRNSFAEAATILRGLSDILYAATSPQDASLLPASMDESDIGGLIEIIGSIRQVATRLDAGLPEDVIWMGTLMRDGSPVVNRLQIMGLRSASFTSPDQILDTGKFPALMAAMGTPSSKITVLAQNLQAAVRDWRLEERQRLMESQRRRLPNECKDLITKFYRSREKDFELCLEEAFACLGIKIDNKDDGTTQSFPDFVTSMFPPKQIAVECKSKTGNNYVNFNEATDVIRKASVNGLESSFKVTVCQPYISPDVTRNLVKCRELCVVNAEDLAEGLVRLKIGKITLEEFSNWIQRPGQAVRDMLPIATVVTSEIAVT